MKKYLLATILAAVVLMFSGVSYANINIESHRKEIYAVLDKHLDLSRRETRRMTELLLFTAAVESDFRQNGNVWFQVQKRTERYIIDQQDKEIQKDLKKLKKSNEHKYYIVLAGLVYKYSMDRGMQLPRHNDRYGQAVVWKKWYNTSSGKGTVKGAYKKGVKYLG